MKARTSFVTHLYNTWIRHVAIIWLAIFDGNLHTISTLNYQYCYRSVLVTSIILLHVYLHNCDDRNIISLL